MPLKPCDFPDISLIFLFRELDSKYQGSFLSYLSLRFTANSANSNWYCFIWIGDLVSSWTVMVFSFTHLLIVVEQQPALRATSVIFSRTKPGLVTAGPSLRFTFRCDGDGGVEGFGGGHSVPNGFPAPPDFSHQFNILMAECQERRSRFINMAALYLQHQLYTGRPYRCLPQVRLLGHGVKRFADCVVRQHLGNLPTVLPAIFVGRKLVAVHKVSGLVYESLKPLHLGLGLLFATLFCLSFLPFPYRFVHPSMPFSRAGRPPRL